MKLPKSVSLERKKRAWELHLRYYKHHEIAEALGIKSTKTVTSMLTRMNKEFSKRFAEEVADIQQGQIARLEKIIRDASDAYQISMKALMKIRTKKSFHPITGLPETENTNETCYQHAPLNPKTGQKDLDNLVIAGDSRHLEVMMKAMAEIRKITGADAPTKSEVKYTDLGLTDDEIVAEAKKYLLDEKGDGDEKNGTEEASK